MKYGSVYVIRNKRKEEERRDRDRAIVSGVTDSRSRIESGSRGKVNEEKQKMSLERYQKQARSGEGSDRDRERHTRRLIGTSGPHSSTLGSYRKTLILILPTTCLLEAPLEGAISAQRQSGKQ